MSRSEVVNVDLNSKPDWFIQRSPFGTVPALEYDNTVVFDSPICVEWLDNRFKHLEPQLISPNPNVVAHQRMMVERMPTLGRWSRVALGKKENMEQAVTDLKGAFATAEQLLKDRDYFGGTSIGWADVMLWPHFERIPVLDLLVPDAKEKVADVLATCPRVVGYMKRMMQHPDIKAASVDIKLYADFFEGYIKGASNYDIGL